MTIKKLKLLNETYSFELGKLYLIDFSKRLFNLNEKDCSTTKIAVKKLRSKEKSWFLCVSTQKFPLTLYRDEIFLEHNQPLLLLDIQTSQELYKIDDPDTEMEYYYLKFLIGDKIYDILSEYWWAIKKANE